MVFGEACESAYPLGGDASSTDVVLVNAWMSAVLHHPALAQTVPGIGGGTLIDAAPLGWNDRLYEAVPLVGGGWLNVDDYQVLDDGLTLTGALVPLPGLDDVDTGARGEVTWRLSSEGPWLELEGADGLWLHTTGNTELEPLGTFRQGRQVLGHDGTLVADQGGAVVLEGVTRLVVADAPEAWAALYADGQRLSGTLWSGDELWVYDADGAWLGTLPLDADTFDTFVPEHAAWVRGASDTLGLGDPIAVGTDIEVSAGAAGSVTITPDWGEHEARPLWLTWEDDGGRHGRGLLTADGGTLSAGAGTFSITFDGGALASVDPLQLVIVDEEEATEQPAVTTHFTPDPNTVLVTLSLEGSQSRNRRVTDGEAFAEAAARGVGFAVMAPPDVIAATTPTGTAAETLRGRDGTRMQGDFTITTWPRSASSRQSGGGAEDPRNHTDPDQALDAALGSQVGSRHSLVDLDWLSVAPEPWAVQPQPDLVQLTAPGTEGPTNGAWEDWFHWLDAAVDLNPVGPYAWAQVPDGALYGDAEVERALLTGALVATSGPWLWVDAEGNGPGDVLDAASMTVDVRDRVDGVDRIGLVVDGALTLTGSVSAGTLQTTLPVPESGRWAVVAVWSSTDASRWAVTAPLWLDPP